MYFPLASGDTTALDITKEPTPTSINPVPYVSALQNLLGNTGKSTANMHTADAMSTYALKLVMNGLLPVKAVFQILPRDRPLFSFTSLLVCWYSNKTAVNIKMTKYVASTLSFKTVAKKILGNTRVTKSMVNFNLKKMREIFA